MSPCTNLIRRLFIGARGTLATARTDTWFYLFKFGGSEQLLIYGCLPNYSRKCNLLLYTDTHIKICL